MRGSGPMPCGWLPQGHWKPQVYPVESRQGHAMDATKLYIAIKAKLGEQRNFVLWWDGQEKQKATPGNLGPSQTTDGPTASRSN